MRTHTRANIACFSCGRLRPVMKGGLIFQGKGRHSAAYDRYHRSGARKYRRRRNKAWIALGNGNGWPLPQTFSCYFLGLFSSLRFSSSPLYVLATTQVTTRGGERLPHYFPSTQDAKPNLPLAAVTNAVHLPLDRSTGSPRLPQLAEPMTWKRPPPPPQIVAEHHYSAAQWPDAVTASAAERALWRAVVDADSKCISPPAPCSAAYKAGGTTTKGASASGARSGARGKSKRRSALDTLVHGMNRCPS
eukprot:SAG31_NODE_231_length_19768_cov_9.498170_17_plen_247_part_00